MTKAHRFIYRCRKTAHFLAFAVGVLALASGVLAPRAEGKKAMPPREPHYRPHLLASADEAVVVLEQLTPFLTNGQGENASCVIVGQSGMKIFWDEPAAEASRFPQFFRIRSSETDPALPGPCSYTHQFFMRYAEVNSLGYDTGEEGKLTIRLCRQDNTCQSVQSRMGAGQDRALMNALLTLIVTGGNQDVVALDTPWSSIASQPKMAKKLYEKLNMLDAGLVAMVQSGSPSEAAGLRDGDLITAIDGAAYRENLYGEMAAKCLKAEPEGCVLHTGGLRNGIAFTGNIPVKPVVAPKKAQTQLTDAVAGVSSAPASLPEKPLRVPPQEKPSRVPFIEPAPVDSASIVPVVVPSSIAAPRMAPEMLQRKSTAETHAPAHPKANARKRSSYRRSAAYRVRRHTTHRAKPPEKATEKPAAEKPGADSKKPAAVPIKLVADPKKPKPVAEKEKTAPEKPVADSKKPATATKKPEADSKKPQAAPEKPKSASGKPSAASQKPSSAPKQ